MLSDKINLQKHFLYFKKISDYKYSKHDRNYTKFKKEICCLFVYINSVFLPITPIQNIKRVNIIYLIKLINI